jgi:tryptophan synthase alpha chain
MSRISGVFIELRKQGRTALIPFVTAGDPDPEVTVPLLHAMVDAGADIIELGIPFSDPMADGPVIQRASERALEQGISLNACLEMVRRFRETDPSTPIVLMGYLNPIEVMGYGEFAERARAAGVDGTLIVDIPPEEGSGLLAALREREIDSIYLIAPTSTTERIRLICDVAGGFIYYVAIKGVTGAAHLDVAAVNEKLGEIRQETGLPVGVGFGIKDAESAARVAETADAVVVGSAIVGRIEQLRARPDAIAGEVAAFLRGLRSAIDQVKKA